MGRNLRETWEQGDKRIGLALGSGGARGWAHLGALQAFDEAGIRPEIVTGTSMGAIVGAAYACGHWRELTEAARNLTLQQVLPYFTDLSLGGSGLISGRKIMNRLRSFIDDIAVENLPMRYAAIATDLSSGSQIGLDKGPLLRAVRASMSIPGIFKPVVIGQRVLVDGALVNPVPVSVAHELGAELVIAVDVNHDPIGSRRRAEQRERQQGNTSTSPSKEGSMRHRLQHRVEQLMSRGDKTRPPGILSIMADSLSIMETRIGEALLKAHPPEILIRPDVAYLGVEEFHRAAEGIAEGYRVAVEALASAGMEWPPHSP